MADPSLLREITLAAPPLPHEVLALLARALPTIAHVEALILLYRTDPTPWSVPDAARELKLNPLLAAAALADLVGSRLATASGSEEDPKYAFTGDADDRKAVAALLDAYNRKPVTLINALYKRQAPAAQAFADAFRLRKDEHG